MKIVRWRSVGSTLGQGDTLREVAEVLIEGRVLRRAAGMIDLFDGGGQSSEATENFILYSDVHTVGRGAEEFIEPVNLGCQDPHR